MLRYRFVALVALAVMLVGAVLLELLDTAGGGQVNAIATATRPAVTAPAPGRQAPPRSRANALQQASAQQDQWSRTILERPLFSPSRRPNAAAVAAASAPPRLAGIVVGPSGNHAIFAGTGEARAVLAGVGAQVGPYLIRGISADGVDVSGPKGEQHLLPHYDGNAAAASASGPGGVAAPAPTGGSILDMLRARIGSGSGGSAGPSAGVAMHGPFRPPAASGPPPDPDLPANRNPSRR